ncbi:hypothetical protein B0E53_04577 [Micromonospora sp. MH33]|nr:hypothetical protein B0E53_04577 [Micromonospora sp. MH33]
MAASHCPAFGLGWSLRSRRQTRQAAARSPCAVGATATVSSPVSRAGTRLSRSSRRAAGVPKRAYRGERWPTIASSVLAAR